jgi:hypothetical protein
MGDERRPGMLARNRYITHRWTGVEIWKKSVDRIRDRMGVHIRGVDLEIHRRR